MDYAGLAQAERLHPDHPSGIIGSVVATWLGQQIGWYGPGDGAGFLASIVGAVIILLAWGQIVRSRA